jgi:tetratricopeptide (TPR) repeat protein
MRKLALGVLVLLSLSLFAATPAETVAAARAALAANDFEKAEKLYEQVIAADPKNARYHYLLGAAYGQHAQNAGMFAMASLAKKTKEEFEKAVSLDPSYIDARFALIDYYTVAPGFMGGSMEKAQEQADAILKLDPEAGHRAQGRVYLRQKKNDLARKEYVDMVRENPKSAKAHYFLGNFLLNEKNWKGAEHEFDMALQLDPTYMATYYRLGQLAARSESNYARGEESLRKYLAHSPVESEPDHAGTWYWLGQIQEKQGKKADAKASYSRALKLAPASKDIKEALKRMS